MTKLFKLSTALLIALLLVPAAYATTLQEAKEQGLVGEQRDGYLGLVVANAPADVVQLVQDVNNQRRQRYLEIARENGINLEQVAALAYERAVEATEPGHYIQLPNGNWTRK